MGLTSQVRGHTFSPDERKPPQVTSLGGMAYQVEAGKPGFNPQFKPDEASSQGGGLCSQNRASRAHPRQIRIRAQSSNRKALRPLLTLWVERGFPGNGQLVKTWSVPVSLFASLRGRNGERRNRLRLYSRCGRSRTSSTSDGAKSSSDAALTSTSWSTSDFRSKGCIRLRDSQALRVWRKGRRQGKSQGMRCRR